MLVHVVPSASIDEIDFIIYFNTDGERVDRFWGVQKRVKCLFYAPTGPKPPIKTVFDVTGLIGSNESDVYRDVKVKD